MASCSAGVAAAAGAAAGAELFSYNRENYLYDRKMRLETEYKIMDYRIQKTALFRQDVSDIVALTAVKMDTYLIVNAVQLGFVVMAFCEGRLAPGTPSWLVGAHTLCMAASFLYFMLSVYFAMHATVASKSFEVRILTQWVRLPVPSWSQIEGARTYASTFEKIEPRQMFRVPFACGKQEQVLEASKRNASESSAAEFSHEQQSVFGHHSVGGLEPARKDVVVQDDIEEAMAADSKPAPAASSRPSRESNDPWGLERPGDELYELDGTLQTDVRQLRHIQLVREALTYWQAYDGFARVSMSIGTRQLVSGLAYYVLGYVLASNHAIVASWLAVILFMAIIWGLIRIDMSLTRLEYAFAVPVSIGGPLITSWCTKVWAQDELHTSAEVPILMPIVFLLETTSLLFLLYVCKVVEQKNGVKLPTGFRSVLYLDVFGWIQRNATGATLSNKLSRCLEAPGVLAQPAVTPGAGPSIQSVRYDKHGRPVPLRVEQLPGAARQQLMSDLTKADFLTTTFVPCEKDETEPDENMLDEMVEPDAGGRPWKIFRFSTLLIAAMWFLSGIGVYLELWGFTEFSLSPLLVEPSRVLDTHMEQALGLLQSGQALVTAWPNEQVRPVAISCHGASNTVVASTRFALYTADIQSNLQKPGNEGNDLVKFEASPLCEHIQGESLQDVSLRCGSAGACHTVVLHGQGKRLSTCVLGESSLNATSGVHEMTSGEKLLQDGGALDESAVGLAMGSECHGKVRDCAYVRTTGQRIVEMRRAADGSHEWFPHRLLRQSIASSRSMGVIHDRYLGVLHGDGKQLQVIDLQNESSVVHSWQLPDTLGGQPFGAMCAAGDNIFFLGRGASPQLWRFPVPQQLRTGAALVEDGAKVGVEDKVAQTSLGTQFSERFSRTHGDGDKNQNLQQVGLLSGWKPWANDHGMKVVYGVFTSPLPKYAQQLAAVEDTWAKDVPPQKLLVVGVNGSTPGVTYKQAPACQDGHVTNPGISCKEATLLSTGYELGADWVVVLGSDNYVFPKHMEARLLKENAGKAQILGVFGCGKGKYCEDGKCGLCGGAGYAISRGALDKMVGKAEQRRFDNGHYHVEQASEAFIEESMEEARAVGGYWSDQVTSCIARRRGVQEVQLANLYGWRLCEPGAHHCDFSEHVYRRKIVDTKHKPLTFHYIAPKDMHTIHQMAHEADADISFLDYNDTVFTHKSKGQVDLSLLELSSTYEAQRTKYIQMMDEEMEATSRLAHLHAHRSF